MAWLVAALANQFQVGAGVSREAREAATSKWPVPVPAVGLVVEPGVAWLGP